MTDPLPDKHVTLFADGRLRIVRPCCKATGTLRRPAHAVVIRHKVRCRYAA